jgi:hypothetical protein
MHWVISCCLSPKKYFKKTFKTLDNILLVGYYIRVREKQLTGQNDYNQIRRFFLSVSPP